MKKWILTAVAVLASVVALGVPSAARADIELALQEDGGSRIVVNTSLTNDVSFSGDFSIGGVVGSGDFTISILGGHRDNGVTMSDLLSSTVSVKNNTGVAHTLHLWVSSDGYTLPLGGLLGVESSMGGTLNTGTLTPTFQAYADKANAIFGTSDFTNGLQTTSFNGSSFDTGSKFGVFSRTGNYSLTSVTNLALGGGAQANYSSHVNVTAVPAPAGVVLALTALPCLGLGFWRRRRQQA